MGEARPYHKFEHEVTTDEAVRRLEKRLLVERRLRKAAEDRARIAVANATRFHALLIQARVALINKEHS